MLGKCGSGPRCGGAATATARADGEMSLILCLFIVHTVPIYYIYPIYISIRTAMLMTRCRVKYRSAHFTPALERALPHRAQPHGPALLTTRAESRYRQYGG